MIDQFEELFALVDDGRSAAVPRQPRRRGRQPTGRVLVVLAFGADWYHRPLAYGGRRRLGPGVVNALPLTTEEFEAAAQEPAAPGVSPSSPPS